MKSTAENDGKGCGGVMRTAPVGLFFSSESDPHVREAFDMGTSFAALTHGHPTGSLSACAFAALVGMLAAGATLTAAVEAVMPVLRQQPEHYETERALTRAFRLEGGGCPKMSDIERLGGGWVADEALAIA